MKAKEYFKKNYDENHIKEVVEKQDYVSLYGLIEEYAENELKQTKSVDIQKVGKDLTMEETDVSGVDATFTAVSTASINEVLRKYGYEPKLPF